MTEQRDLLHRFIFQHSNVRGEFVQLDTTWQAMLERQDYPPQIRQLLGEAVAATALLAATIKFDGSLILQTHGSGPLKMLVVECSGRHTLRGLARWEGEVEGLDFNQLMGNGRLVMTIDPGENSDRYQGIVSLEGNSISECLQQYFIRSEQLPTQFWLSVDAERAAGLLVQQMPATGLEFDDDDIWTRITTLAQTVTDEELQQLEARELLSRLFHEEQIEVFDPQQWQFECHCSRERVAVMLKGLGRSELDSILHDEGKIEIDCEYCGSDYGFDAVDVEQLFSDAINADPPADTRH